MDVLFLWAKSTLFRLEGSIPFNTKLYPYYSQYMVHLSKFAN